MTIFPSRCYYQMSRFKDIKILFFYLNILMMLDKILIQWFSFDVTTRSLPYYLSFFLLSYHSLFMSLFFSVQFFSIVLFVPCFYFLLPIYMTEFFSNSFYWLFVSMNVGFCVHVTDEKGLWVGPLACLVFVIVG